VLNLVYICVLVLTLPCIYVSVVASGSHQRVSTPMIAAAIKTTSSGSIQRASPLTHSVAKSGSYVSIVKEWMIFFEKGRLGIVQYIFVCWC